MIETEDKIEGIKRRLYEPVDTVTHRVKEGVIHPINHKVEEEWRNEELNNSLSKMKKPKTSIFKKFFIVSIIFFFGAIGFALYMFYTGGTSVSNDNIDIRVIGSAFTKGGEELPLEIEIVNRNKASLELANLMISYPNGASDNIVDYTRMPRIDIGTIKPGETITKSLKIVLFGDEKSNRNIKIGLDYHPEGSNAIFTKEIEYIVNISSSPLSLSVSAPLTVTSDQPISFTVNTILNTSLPSDNIVMQLTYPNNFIYESAIPEPSFGNSIWDLSSLTLTDPVSIVVKGRIVGEDQDQQVFHAYAGTIKQADKSTIDVIYNSLLHTITIVKPFLETNILVNDTSSSGETIEVKVSWKNNLSTRITDGEIIANLGGNVFDRMSVNPSQGFYDSANNRIIWDKNVVGDLASIEPGERGEVSFSVKSIPLLGSQSSIKDPQVTIDVSIRGKQPSFGSTYADINNFSKKVVKILSDFQIASSASYKSGSMPPKAETETQYDITWTLSNGTNAISGATARAAIPIYVKWVGPVSTRENITYNESTREVIWNIGSVRANTGGNYNREATFTLSLKPSVSQIGSAPQLMKDLYILGKDTFTGTDVNNRRGPINTLLYGDPNFQSGQERVIQ
ncbi:TPA: hypothetical protein DEP30_02145 [Candidatus Nomurabacteria bacterium]|uniref:DUF11 domain-containing protein n=1 Tax=Candidatus Nomurabacteria bacterium GW2011_GWE1_35_16 TaxID=1618761 RepID=A0A0G0BBM7_9BACT|nr:MAG: hypothetical protein UR55_C0002G0112 [Candidatus Nomurabacteria bacterium GW2011_GWF1_34_20]KKP63691.1 MAG: hypothetical protein UR57_C0002G0112 [Candidatus Nomurabacteria bacterium GW2011_GWE2_34_25]KKP66893.1 MAG: hypothetical protein UR64_C0002G0109 [Candidatus Nomurabacteria bacterium GW2011_GWE1_35_16]KKP83519.1 MAG: hypothetical protein UR85_C0004G0113 [Candidatus Nomurabacteria bacterium GW2011_GWF2_35_66]HAE36549.1 hypothetical protein [Candidatus Nomurabacteria bacterium]